MQGQDNHAANPLLLLLLLLLVLVLLLLLSLLLLLLLLIIIVVVVVVVLLLFIIYIVNLHVIRPRSCRVIYYFDTPALGRRHQSFGRVKFLASLLGR